MEQILTIKGYDMFEVVSAFQKEIRRCNEKMAMYWGVELYESGFIPYAWKRMMIMSTEDIGLAEPMAPVIINALKQQYDIMSAVKTDRKQQYRLPYTQAILYLANCKKSRHTDWALNYHWDSHFNPELKHEIPNYALDIHTRRGKKMGKTINDFFDEGSLLENHKVLENETYYMQECRKRWTDKDWCIQQEKNKKQREERKANKNKPEQPKPVQNSMNFDGN